MQSIVDEMLGRLFAPSTRASHPEVIETVRQMIVRTKPDGAAAALKAMAERDDLTTFLPRIECPTLVICGRHDVITPPQDSELMHREIKGSQLVMIEDAGHVSNLEQSEQFNRALVGFLQAV
jgi:pimeloyl-ACP methyl ester carboxylesterase